MLFKRSDEIDITLRRMDLCYNRMNVLGILFCLSVAASKNVEFSDRAFVTVWNAPTAKCETKYGVKLNLSYFDIVVNHNYTSGLEIVIFYARNIGLYPAIDANGTFINGGLPQLANITAHLAKVAKDVKSYIPDDKFTGLAVIDWESWKLIFKRNLNKYKHASEDLVRKKHPDWSKDRIENEAEREFEKGARTFTQSTLETCRKLRPGGYWGLYGFPGCAGHLNGTCSPNTFKYNDRLGWFFKASTALYPSIYLHEAETPFYNYNRVYVQLKETDRVKKKFGAKYLPIVPYSRFRYRDTLNFYNKSDLINSIQQVAETGQSGMVFWGGGGWYAKTCLQLQQYLDTTLGPFVKNVTMTARKCSKERCNSHGRCSKTDWKPKSSAPDTLHFESLSKQLWSELFQKVDYISSTHNGIKRAFGAESTPNADGYKETMHDYSRFACNCFPGWTGVFCEQRNAQA